jgi:hypothetical protein
VSVVANLVAKISADTDDFRKDMGKLEGFTKGLAGQFTTMFAAFSGAALVDRAVSTFTDWTREAVRSAGALVDMADKTGLSMRTLQQMGFVAKQTGTDVRTFSSAALMLGVNIEKGTTAARAAVKDLGLSFAELSTMSPDEQWNAIVAAAEKLEDPQRRNKDLLVLMGKVGKEALAGIAGGYTELAAGANIAGDAQIRAIDKASDRWDAFVENQKTSITQFLGNLVMATDKAGPAGFFEQLGLRGFGGFGTVDLNGPPGVHGKDIVLRGKKPPSVDPEVSAALKKALAEKERAAEQWKKFDDDMFGRTAMATAKDWMDHLGGIGNLTKLSADKQQELNKVLADALGAYYRLGGEAPRALTDLYVATLRLVKLGPEMTTGLQNLVDVSGKLQVGKELAAFDILNTPGLRDAFIPNLGVTSGLGGLNLPGGFNPTAGFKPASFMQQLGSGFGSAKDFGAQMSQTIMAALTGGGSVGKSIGGLIGGRLFGGENGKGGLAGMVSGLFGKTGIGGALGGALGAVIPGLGTMLGSMLGPLMDKVGGFFSKIFGKGDDGDKQRDAFLKQMGGFDSLAKKLHEVGKEGDAMFNALSGAKNGKDAEAAINNITAALERQKQAIDTAMSALPEGANKRSANITGQQDANVVGAEALGAFMFQVQQGASAIAAFTAIQPAVTALKEAFAANNFEMSGAVERLFALNGILTENKVQFDNVSASGGILSAMLGANIKDLDLFNAVSMDIGTNLQAVIDRGVPMAQVFALAQPQLQAIWEAEQKWGFQVDANTQSLLDQAAAQGFVGEAMKSVNQQILDVLLSIAKVMGADIPAAAGAMAGAAKQAADGMNAAFGGVRPPDMGGLWNPWAKWEQMHPGEPNPYGETDPQAGSTNKFATGGIVRARPGGTRVTVGEGGQDEAIIPVNRLGGVTINVEGSLVHQDDLEAVVAAAWANAVRSNRNSAFTVAQAVLGLA